ncbi:MITOTIC-SPINDLE ORGANIZING PROTEIN 1A-LIKE [Salix koriyanagi]|uniref:MITOTIC-SPINDLE ORGANIZING PROTEIN 1A-LIKE n=1 Tax=Salix koriyanagi TaxID=2511006 RepID=A0A9Q1APQ6_9ROSI|nr:MITOTIC-SPINDLE ORGANIZING PROTEIN 1A-LIKE [Salix koriyanagi]
MARGVNKAHWATMKSLKNVRLILKDFIFSDIVKIVAVMDPEAAKTARESLELAFHMSNLLDTGLDRHTLSVLIALCDLGLNPEALAAVVKELRREPASSSLLNSSAPMTLNALTGLQYGFTQQDHWIEEIQV